MYIGKAVSAYGIAGRVIAIDGDVFIIQTADGQITATADDIALLDELC